MILDALKRLFAVFLRSHAFTRHFRRLALLETVVRTAVPREFPAALAATLSAAAASDSKTLLEKLNSNPDGISNARADLLRLEVGPNEVEHEKPLPWWRHLWLAYRTPFSLLLTALALVSYATGDLRAMIVIAAMVLLATLIRFWQETKSSKAAEKLKAMVRTTATVLRSDISEEAAAVGEKYFSVGIHVKPARRSEIPINELVPGDIVLLSAGDMIPADCRILVAKDLFVSQAAMTGESLPVEKFAALRNNRTATNPFDLDNIVFMGTNVVSGSASAVVVSTGNRTYFGALAARVVSADVVATQFQVGVNQVSWLMIRFILVMTPLVLVINGYTKGDWLEAFLFALSIAVGLTPEMLPMIVTSTLAKGAVFLSRKKVIVKRLDAIQNFGAMDVLCTDKTGTLTQDKIALERHTDVWGDDSDTVLEYAYLNSFYQTGLKNLLDVAVLTHAEVNRELEIQTAFRKVDEVPFDFQRRRMSVVVAERDEHHLLICKGALEEILGVCSWVRHDGTDEPLDPELLQRVREVTASLNEQGLRVVAVAAKQLPPTKETYGVADECDLTLIGYVTFLDPPKDTAAPALKTLAEHGVTLKVLTGDNELVTAKICSQVGLRADGIVLGADIEKMDDESLERTVEQRNVFARLTPAQKDRIVRTLKARGHVVGFMGDGINDAAALRTADIGISVDSGVDIAKEAADIILLEKSLLILEEGVIEGRKTFVNMLKYIKMAASSNFGNVFSVLIASAFLPFLPMLPIQLLVQNLLYDVSQTAIPFDTVDEELLRKPQRWNPGELGRFMLFFGPISSIFDIVTFALMWWVFRADTWERQTLFQSGWFVEGLLTQTLIVHTIRTQKIPFVQSRAAPALLLTTLGIMAIGVLMVMGPVSPYFKMRPLPLAYFAYLVVILFSYMALTQVMKGFYSRRYGWQ
ncbi:MAG TPA: magnesium-translocating P-type ATPase [Burkholderiales bacterium]|nr:magnesium-translocating P-type ATPase [Burkholderiales bacterium]